MDNPSILPVHNRILLVLLIGLVTFPGSMYISHLTGLGPGDLLHSLWPAREWLSGKDPYLTYRINNEYEFVPYPFTAIIATLPLTWLPDWLAAGIFSCLGAMLLAWMIITHGKNWQLIMLASWPFVNSIIFTQWSPYLVSMFFTPNLLPFLLIKPQLALPFTLIQKPGRLGIILAGILGILSLVLFPSWPFEWLKTLGTYIGYPPLFVLPFGPLLLLSFLRYRNKSSWLLVLLALMPQRMVYDQLGVLLIAENRKQLLFLVLCSWITLPVVVYYGGWNYVPWGWQQWVLIGSYLPALLVVLWPLIKDIPVRIGIKPSEVK
jgi:hypothetical protein